MLDVAGSVLSKPATRDRCSVQIDEAHLVWLMWFAMRHGVEKRDETGRIWSFSHVGVDLKIEARPEGECQRITAQGRRWSLQFFQQDNSFRVEDVKQPVCFWRDLTVLRLCDESPLPH